MGSVNLEATVEQITFRNEENGWTVMRLRSGRNRVTAVGTVMSVNVGEKVQVSGEWTEHRDYGKQLKLDSCEAMQPSRTQDIEKYLSSGVIKGIGPATARIIVQKFGRHTLDILDESPDKLTEIPGIGPKRAAMIAESYHEQIATRGTFMYLQKLGMSPDMANKVFKAYGTAAETILRANPYQLVRDISGIGFLIADRLAMSAGIPRESPFRVQSGIIYALQEASAVSGHVYLPVNELLSEAQKLLGLPLPLCQTALETLIAQTELQLEEVEIPPAPNAPEGAPPQKTLAVYQDSMLYAENNVAYCLAALLRTPKQAPRGNLEKLISDFERKNDIKLSREQCDAVKLAVSSGVSVITGGPGTGKTTIIKCILSLLPGEGNIALCAPTGRAARRMTEATGVEAKTVHRLLEYGGADEGNFGRNKENPLRVRTLICDEVSMVDIMLMRSLLHALPDSTRLILVGDADQLPSVGPGCVLRDIIESGQVPCVRLTEIHRQSEDSMIALNAHSINTGLMPVLNKKGGDFFLVRRDNVSDVVTDIVALVKNRLPSFTGADPVMGIQTLTPAKRGDTGVWALNRALQQALNPPEQDKPERVSGEHIFRLGDKVMHIKNDYELNWQLGDEYGTGVFNGDMGLITAIDTEARSLTVTFDDDRVAEYDDSNLDELELAYCISVHKSQGSEFPVIVMPVMPAPRMLMARNLLYTAVTRARKYVVLVGRESVIREMIDNNIISRRYTALAHRLRHYCGEIALAADEAEQLSFDTAEPDAAGELPGADMDTPFDTADDQDTAPPW